MGKIGMQGKKKKNSLSSMMPQKAGIIAKSIRSGNNISR